MHRGLVAFAGAALVVLIAAQLADLRKDEDVMAASRRWSDLSERTRRLLITAAVGDGALRVAALTGAETR